MSIRPDVVLDLTDEQKQAIKGLQEKQTESKGLILGSVGVHENSGKISLSYIPYPVGKKIAEFAEEALGGKSNGER